MISLVEIRSFDRNTFRQTSIFNNILINKIWLNENKFDYIAFSRFGHVIRSYFGYAYKIRYQIECRLLYCIKFYIISVSIPFGKHSADSVIWFDHISVRYTKFSIKSNGWLLYYIKFCIISITKPIGKHSANSVM